MRLAKGTFTVFPSNLATEKRLSTNEQIALLWICKYINESGVCWPSKKTLCEDSGLSLSSMHRAIESLEEKGVLKVTTRITDEGRTTSNQYEVIIGEQATESIDKPRREKSSKKKLDDIPVIASLKDIWCNKTGGTIHAKDIYGLLGLLKKHGYESVASAFERFIDTTPPKYRSVKRFIENPNIVASTQDSVLDFGEL